MAIGRIHMEYLADTFANRPTASAVRKGALFLATDTGNFYVSDGVSAWTQITNPIEWIPTQLIAVANGVAPLDTTTRVPLVYTSFDNVQTGNVGTDANTNEKTLFTYDIPANTLNANGRGIKLSAWGLVSASANAKTMRLYFGSAVVASNDVTTSPVSEDWTLSAGIYRRTAGNQNAFGLGFVNAITQSVNSETPTEDETGIITVKVTGQNGSLASADDIVAKGFVVEVV